MIARITRAKSGLSEYLISGKRQDSIYTRNDKDEVIPIYGNLQTFKKTEEYLNKSKDYKENYLHITISYSKEDMQKMANMSDDEVMLMKRDIIETYIKHHTSGYDTETEVIAYAETHKPKIKNEHGKERLEHEHIAIALYDPLSDTKLQTTFHNNSFIDDTLQAYVNKKYGLSHPRSEEHTREERQYISKNGLLKKEWTERLKHLNNSDELIHTLNNKYGFKKDIDYKIAGSKNFKYIKLINKGKNKNGLCDINLNNKELAHLVVLNKKEFIPSRDKGIKELEKILTDYYKSRIEQIDKRRSKATKEAIKEIYKDIVNDNETSLTNISYQQKILYKHYGHLIDSDLKGYFIDTKENETRFINKKKNINIIDKGDKIVSLSNDKQGIEERVKLMIDVALAKGWKLENLQGNGNPQFKREFERQVAERIKAIQEKQQTLSYTVAEAVKEDIEKRPKTATQNIKKQESQKQEQKEMNKDISLSLLKDNLKAQVVLDFAVEKYKLNINDYDITKDNKIKNKNNKQKPKNVIDFIQKELNLKTSEAIDICKELYSNQPINIEVMNDNKKEVSNMALKISICKDLNPNALSKWEQAEISNYSELATYIKQYPYSATVFDNNYRKSDNANSFNNILIYDIDNDLNTPQLTIKKAQELLSKHNISAMIIPSRSNNKEKNGHIAERYRIMIPTTNPIELTDKEEFREFQKLTAKALKLDKYVDNKAMNDKARFYYKSPIEATPIIIKSDRVMKLDKLQEVAKENIRLKRLEKEQEQARVQELRNNIDKYRVVTNERYSKRLTYVDTDKILNLDINRLIRHFENTAEEYQEGSYQMIKTSNAKYSLVDNNVAHDFKSNKTFNSLTYLQHKMQETNLNIVARELSKITGDDYIKTNDYALKEALEEALKTATNDRSLEDSIKNSFGVNFVMIDNNSLIVADRVIKLKKLDIDKATIISHLQSNRKAREEEQRLRNYNSYERTL